MHPATLVHCDSPEEVALKGAEIAWQDFQTSGATPYTLAISGGRIAGAFCRNFARLVTLENSARLNLFWVDERCVPPEHPESNFRIADEHLIRPLGLLPSQVYRIKGELSPSAAAAAASDALVRACQKPQGFPVLNCVFLGLGEDGHTASLFPGSETTALVPDVYRAVTSSPKPPPNRVTLSYRMLAAAGLAVVLVNGTAKTEALRASLTSQSTPLGTVLASRSMTQIVTDIPGIFLSKP